jgi:hypothetical protein
MIESSSKIKQKFRHLKPRVITFRKSGKTYNEIRRIYNIPKSTLSYWLKKVRISTRIKSEMQRKWEERNKVLAKIRSEEAAKIREEYKEKAAKEIKNISKKSLRFIGTALYWAEGNIKNRNRLQFGNSNPLMIRVAMRFLREVCNIPKAKIKARVHIYPGMNYRKVLNFWSQITKLPKSNFLPPQIQASRASKGKRPRNTLPYGTLHLTISNTELACKVKGWIKGISDKI